MKQTSFHILRIGVAITFVWIGILIFKSPEGWGSFLQPWAAGLLPVPLRQAMFATAVLDIGIGLLLLVDVWTWFAALLGAWHIVMVLALVGISDITVRDIGLFSATLALLTESIPVSVVSKLQFWRNSTHT